MYRNEPDRAAEDNGGEEVSSVARWLLVFALSACAPNVDRVFAEDSCVETEGNADCGSPMYCDSFIASGHINGCARMASACILGADCGRTYWCCDELD